MNVWHSVNLGDAMLASDRLERIEKLFLTEYVKAGRPVTMALFTRHESPGDLHCELVVYLSPASLVAARAVDAEPCDRPSPGGLSLRVGEEASWGLLFPEGSG